VSQLIQAVTLVGVLTTYAGRYVGQQLYCDRGQGLTYRDDISFVALPVTEYESGRAECGDTLRGTVNGTPFWALALDAGPLEKYHVKQFGSRPIVGDVPVHLWEHSHDISGLGSVFNMSAFNRACGDCKMGRMK